MATEASKTGKIHQVIGAVVDVVCSDENFVAVDVAGWTGMHLESVLTRL